MYKAILVAVFVFVVIFGVMRMAEWTYHRFKHTPDWSPHWGSWAFALLSGLFALVSDLGRNF